MNNAVLLGIAAVAAFMFLRPQATTVTPLELSWIEKISANPEWMASIQQKAAERGLSVEEMLLIEAKWIIEQGWQL